MKDNSILHILTERNVAIFSHGGPKDPKHQNSDTSVTFLKFSEPQGPKSSESALSLCAKLKYLSIGTGFIKIG